MIYKKYFLIVSLMLFAFVFNATGQGKSKILNEMFKERGEVYFQFNHPGQKILSELINQISVDNFSEDLVYAYANEKEFDKFLNYGISYEVLTPPSMLYPAKMKSSVNLKEVNDWDFYPTYDAYIDMMEQFETDYPELCTVFSIGQSIQGRELLVAKISDNIGTNEGEPQFLYTSSMHGDELTGYVLTLRLIDYLLSNYGSDPKVDNLVNNLEIWINPLANPDGTFYGGNNTVNGAIRYNSNWVDLNRNYADPEDGPHPDGNEWQQETVMFMQMAEANQFIAGANFHGGAEVCNYPWDTWAQLAADDDWWQYVCHEWADTAQYYSPSGYLNGFDDGITNGYAWYSISGGRQDYMNFFHQCREFTMEISNTKLIPASQLPNHWDWNFRSMLNYMEQSLFGVSGAVTDANTGNPLYAEVYIENHDMDSSWVYTYDINGKYYRLLYEGTYDITFTADGYYPQTIEDVVVVNKQLTILDVQLNSGDLIVDFQASETSIPVGTAIDFTDLTFGSPVSWEWTFEGGTPSSSFDQNPTGILYDEEGDYDVTLTVSDGTNSQTIIKEDYISVSVDFIIQNTTVTTCTGIFWDSGGSSGDYGNNEDFTMTFMPGDANSKVSVDFTYFDVEWESACDYDWLKIYDGESTSSTLMGKYCGTDSPGSITATNDEGALTFQFYSDGSVTEGGWSAAISCETMLLPPVADFMTVTPLIFEGGTVSFTDQSINNPDTWEWEFEGGEPASSNLQTPEVTYNIAGVYDVTLTVTNSAGSNTLTKEDYITVEEEVGVTDYLKENVSIFPNPATDNVQITSKEEVKSIVVMDLFGEEKIRITSGKTQTALSVSHLSSGIYLIIIQTTNNTEVHKLELLK